MIIGSRSSKMGVILIEIRIWDPDNCFSWTTGRILMKFGELGYISNLILVIRWVRFYSSVGESIVLKPRGSRVRTSVWAKFFVSLFVCLFVCRISHKLLVGFWWNFGEYGGNDHRKSEFKVGRDPDWNPDLRSRSTVSHELLVGFWWNSVSWDYNSNLVIVIRLVRPYSSVGERIVLKPRGSRVRASVWPKFFVCLFVCLLAGFLRNFWSDSDEIWWVRR